MICDTNGCESDACMHLSSVDNRHVVESRSLCDLHASVFLGTIDKASILPSVLPAELQFFLYLMVLNQNSAISHFYLRSADGSARIVLGSGYIEHANIATLLATQTLTRPPTHQVLVNTITSLGGTLDKIIITNYNYDTGVIESELRIKSNHTKSNLTIDIRPSDSIALAILTDMPIMVSEVALRKLVAKEVVDRESERKLGGS